MNESEIRRAIQNKLVIEFTYSNRLRVIEPHVLGVCNGNVQVLAYQIGGQSSSGGLPEWRRFDLFRISNLRVTSQTFAGRRPFPSGTHSPWDRELEIVPA
ncbi:WYL domain-containing protein [Vibrio parahaemolyticus]|nr:WYL domain-containing protein [Vibrio parahaemolyticus]